MNGGKILPIVVVGGPYEHILSEKGKEVTDFGPAREVFARDMIATMNHAGGIGIAAHQVKSAERMCVIDVSKDSIVKNDDTCKLDKKRVKIHDISPIVAINPEILAYSTKVVVGEEGCLSIPGVCGNVQRSKSITFKYQDLKGMWHEMECDGMLSICSQHEIDHTNGIKFTDKVVGPTWNR
jgi:peptide deformylase